MKYSIVQLLKDAAPNYVSGGEIAKRFGVTRSAVWKCVEDLRQEGYSIEAITRRGYRLIDCGDNINAYEIENDLGTTIVGQKVIYLDCVDSTNSYARKIASEGAADGTVVVAGQQTAGRGRLGRDWESSKDKGIYISVVLRPPMAPAETPILTLAASVAVSNAIKKETGIAAGIKWPNDLVYNGKKLCGILLEMRAETDRINNIVLGIGINYSQSDEDFPESFRNRAISLKAALESPHSYTRLSIIRSVLRELDDVINLILTDNYSLILDMWRERTVTIGKEVKFNLKDTEYKGVAVGITSDGKLAVNCTDGVRRELLSGEVSVRGIYGYT